MAERSVRAGAAVSLTAVWASLAAVACTASTTTTPSDTGPSSVTAGDSDAAPADAAPTCQSGSYHVDTWAPPMTKVGAPASGDPGDSGASGALTFILESDEVGDAGSSPVEPYTNVFTLKLTDASGQPVTNATVLLPTNDQALGWSFSKDPWMPLHGHGAPVANTITNNGDGTYTISTDFFMAGLWQMYIVAETDTVTDAVMYSFCLQ